MKKRFYTCIFISFFFALANAYAQEATPPTDTTAAEAAPKPEWPGSSGAWPGRERGGAVSTLSDADFNQGPIIYSPLQLIQGRVAGLAIMRTGGGDPFQQMQVQLRGISTLYGSPDLLYVIDGVPQASPTTVMPEDIETIEVLRSTSATAAYGVRGANGVVLITTKRGTQGRPVVSYTAFGYFETIRRKAEFLTADEWRGVKRAWANSSRPQLQGISTNMTDYGAATDWLREISRHKVSQIHNLSVSGGTAKTNYYAAASYRDLPGVLTRSENRLVNGRVSVSQRAWKDKLRFDGSVAVTPGRYRPYQRPIPDRPDFDLITEAQRYLPTAPLSGLDNDEVANPVRQLNLTGNRQDRTDWLARAGISYQVVKGLTFKALVAGQRLHEKAAYRRTIPTFSGSNVQVRQLRKGETTRSLETTLHYRLASPAGHHLDLLAGYADQQFRPTFTGRDSTYQNGRLSSWGGRDFSQNSRVLSWFTHAAYQYRNRYFLSAGLRRDQSPAYDFDNTAQYYPAFSLGWRIRNEAFMAKASWLSELTLRAGYGTAGRPVRTNNFNFVELGRINPSVRGEKLTEVNLGADVGVGAGRLRIQVEYYRRTTHDLLVEERPFVVPGEPPVTYVFNRGKLRNRGWEIAVHARPVATGRFGWRTGANVAFNRNALLFEVSRFPNSLMQGQPVGMMYGYRFAGFSPDGVPEYRTQSGQRQSLLAPNAGDLAALGNGSPKTHFGFSNSLTYGKVALTVLLRGAAGFQILNRHRAEHTYAPATRFNRLRDVQEMDHNVVLNSELLGRVTDYFIEKGDFMKVDNLTLGYTLPLKSRWVQHVKVYAAGHNLATFTRFKGLDPEMAGITGDRPGIYEANTYFATRVWSLGVNASL